MEKLSLTAERPEKLYFPIREVAQMTGLEAHVLRFWEKEFPILRPIKGKAGQRRYRRKDIELIREIKRLLYEEGFTIAGARNELRRITTPSRASGQGGAKQSGLPLGHPSRSVLSRIRRELNEILTLLDKS